MTEGEPTPTMDQVIETANAARDAVNEAVSGTLEPPTVLDVLNAFIVSVAQVSGQLHRPVLEITLDEKVWLQAFSALCRSTKRQLPEIAPEWFELRGAGAIVVQVKRPLGG